MVVTVAGSSDALPGTDPGTVKVAPFAEYPGKGRALVEGFHFVKKALRKTQDNPNGGIVEKEAPLAVSKLAVVTRAEKKTEKE